MVVTDRADDNVEIQTVKELIRQATLITPEDRPAAAWILKQLKGVLKVCKKPFFF